MITWIKFSERQPEKREFYLFANKDAVPFVGFFKPNGVRIYTRSQYGMTEQLQFIPDYWAEINPPETDSLNELGKQVFPGWQEHPEGGLFCGKTAKSIMQKIADKARENQKETPMSEKPLCKDCRWVDLNHFCHSPNADRSRVDGSPNQRCVYLRDDVMTAGGVRSDPERCDPEGKWFEAKEGVRAEVPGVHWISKPEGGPPIPGDKVTFGGEIQEYAKYLKCCLVKTGSPYRAALTAGETTTLIDLLSKIS